MNPVELPLRDIHLPDPVGWWPPAPGWWMVAVLLLLMVFAAVTAWRHRVAWRRSAVYLAGRELETLKDAWREHRDAHRLVRETSVWLRRVAMSLRDREQAAGLTGTRWWRYLDELADDDVFGAEGGRLIGDAPYRAAADVDPQQLIALCERWLAGLGRTARAQRS